MTKRQKAMTRAQRINLRNTKIGAWLRCHEGDALVRRGWAVCEKREMHASLQEASPLIPEGYYRITESGREALNA